MNKDSEDDITARKTGDPPPCLPLAPHGPPHQANYPSINCANAAKALRHPVLIEGTGSSAA